MELQEKVELKIEIELLSEKQFKNLGESDRKAYLDKVSFYYNKRHILSFDDYNMICDHVSEVYLW